MLANRILSLYFNVQFVSVKTLYVIPKVSPECPRMLTIAEVKNAKPKDKEYMLADGRGGLYLRVKPSGHRAWIYKYSINGEKES